MKRTSVRIECLRHPVSPLPFYVLRFRGRAVRRQPTPTPRTSSEETGSTEKDGEGKGPPVLGEETPNEEESGRPQTRNDGPFD